MAKTAADRLAEIERKTDALKARKQAIIAREREAERKADTRRKIILAGELLARAAHDARWAGIVAELRAGITRPADLAALNGWTIPSPTSVAQAPTGRVAVVTFPASPDVEVRAALKAEGFVWIAGRHRWEGDVGKLENARRIADQAGGAAELVTE